MTIEQTMTIPADHRLHFDFEVLPQMPPCAFPAVFAVFPPPDNRARRALLQ